MMKQKKFDVIIPSNHPSPPDEFERNAAWVMAEYYDCIVEFIIPINAYKRTTLDTLMNGQFWEIKTPDGDSKKNTIRDQFDRASYQKAEFLAINSENTKLTDDFIAKQIVNQMKHHRRLKKVILITKDKKVLEFDK
jgi:hypothetical protein